MKIGLLIIILFFSHTIYAQDYPINQYMKDLATDDQEQSFRLNEVFEKIRKFNFDEQKKILLVLEKSVKQEKNEFLTTRFSLLKLLIERFYKGQFYTQAMKADFMNNLDKAKELKNEILLADGCYGYAIFLNERQQVAEALFYCLKSIELVEKVGAEKFYGVSHRYRILGELLYHTREYEKSIQYSKKALYAVMKERKYSQKVSTLNTIGMTYQKLHQNDSAIFYFDKSAKSATTQNEEVWVTIPNANKAQVWFTQKKYKQAFPLFEADYRASMKMGDFLNAANNLQWMAKVHLTENKADSALKKAKKALRLLQEYPNSGAIANTYQTLAAVYKYQNKVDSSEYYSLLYNKIHDSTEAVVAKSHSEIVQLRLDDEHNKSKIELLQKQQQTEKMNRNIFIGFILLISLIAFFFYNRQTKNQKQRQQLKEAELEQANEQMELFKKTTFENLELIESLQRKIKQHNLDPDLQQNLEVLKQKTILTEEDWEIFQKLFQKIYPNFFDKLKNTNPSITSAELRFASIIRLQMNNKQAGAMLGISPDSARKTRLRLRQRLNLAEEVTIEQVIELL